MQQLIFRLLPVPLFFLLAFKGMAQNKDTVYLIQNGVNVKSDSIRSSDGVLHVSGGHVYQLKSDTVPLYKRHQAYVSSDSVYRKNDSFYRKMSTWTVQQSRRMDSLKRLNFKSDSSYRRTKVFHVKKDSMFRKNDSLFRKKQILFKKNDSLFRKSDSLYRRTKTLNAAQSRRMDSLKRLNWKTDSVRIKGHLQKLKSDLNRIQSDSVRQIKNLQKKVISMEVSCNKNGTVSIVNLGRKLTIKTTNEDKVKLETYVFVQAGFDPKDVDWQKTMNILVEKNKNDIEIKRTNLTSKIAIAGGQASKGLSSGITSSSSVESNIAEDKKYRVDKKSPLVVYVPAGVKLEVESRYNELLIMNNMTSVDLDLLNTDLQMQDADKAVIKSKYGTVKTGAIKNADIDLLNCKFISGNLNKSEINSKYSTVTLLNSGTIDIRSVSDQYNIASADYVTVNKSFGKMNIAQLGTSIKFTGSSADLEISAIDASATLVQVENKYADVKLPVEKLSNYTVKFDGISSKVFTPFEKVKPIASDSTYSSNTSFTKTMGDVKKDFTAFVVNCLSCSVDFR